MDLRSLAVFIVNVERAVLNTVSLRYKWVVPIHLRVNITNMFLLLSRN